jgi:hypothetical protein
MDFIKLYQFIKEKAEARIQSGKYENKRFSLDLLHDDLLDDVSSMNYKLFLTNDGAEAVNALVNSIVY